MLVIAHRGASAAFPENTLAAFAGAVAQGADGVELDVRRTADGRLALSHDDTLADGRVVAETAWADLPEAVTDLASALDACASLAVVNTEIKNWPDDKDFDPTEALAADVVALLAERGELDSGRNLDLVLPPPHGRPGRRAGAAAPHRLAPRSGRETRPR